MSIPLAYPSYFTTDISKDWLADDAPLVQLLESSMQNHEGPETSLEVLSTMVSILSSQHF